MPKLLSLTDDLIFKIVLADPSRQSLLISLITAVLEPPVPIANVKVLNPDIPKFDVLDKGVVLDVLVELEDGRRVDIEMQVARHPAFRERLLYYWAKLYGGQISRGQAYGELRQVVLVVFTDYEELDSDRIHSVFEVREVHDGQPFTKDLQIHLVELPKFPRGKDKPSKQLERWIRLFRAKNEEQRKTLAKEDKMAARVIEILDELSDDPQVKYWLEKREEAKVFHRMDLAITRRQALEEGLRKGKAEGKAEGMQEGMQKGKAEAIVQILHARSIPVDEEALRRIQHCRDLSVLQQWLERAMTVSSVDEMFGDSGQG